MNWTIAAIGTAILAILFIPGTGLSMSLQNSSAMMLSACDIVFGTLDQKQTTTVKAISNAWSKYGDGDIYKLSYILATAKHEANFIYDVTEHRAAPGTTLYNIQNNYWYTGYYGRGLVQLTLEGNYKKMGDLLGVDFVNNPDLVLTPDNSASILVRGMMLGSFTGKKLGDYINNDFVDFYNARKVVNGLDKADTIKGTAISLYNNMA